MAKPFFGTFCYNFYMFKNFLSNFKFNKNQNYFPPLKNEKGEKTKIFVGLSGGVDSSVSAAILKKKSFDVTGVFIKVYQPEFLDCSWADERDDAKKICLKLNIPFLELDLEKEYKKYIFDYMLETYKKGQTPNPDVFCNKYIKFGAFLDFAEKKGADFVATGHYATKIYDQKKEIFFLQKSKDTKKDQTYFLSQISQKQLSKIIFPIGNLEKKDVRKKAKKFNLFTENKKDSQGLCFVGKIKMREFLQEFIEKKEGDVLDSSGEKIGEHEGAIFYTIGQRHGFSISGKFKKPDQEKLFVLEKNNEENILIVGPFSELKKIDKNLDKIYFKNEIFISENLKKGDEILTQIRYRGEKIYSVLDFDECGFFAKAKKPHSSVSSGQIIAFYSKNGNFCLGSAIII